MDGISSKVEKAHELYSRYGALLLVDPNFCILLDRYKKARDATYRVMGDLGIVHQCYVCGRTEKGSCCAPEVAEWYDVETLFVNLAMGCRLQRESAYPNHCCFLGSDGCTLIARHYFCINFLCDRIKTQLSSEELSRFYKTAGIEVNTLSEIMSYFFLWRKKQMARLWRDYGAISTLITTSFQ